MTKLPKELKGQLPSIPEIEAELEKNDTIKMKQRKKEKTPSSKVVKKISKTTKKK